MVPDELNVYLWRQGFHLFFPMRGPDHWGVVGIVPPDLRTRENLGFEEVRSSIERSWTRRCRFRNTVGSLCTAFITDAPSAPPLAAATLVVPVPNEGIKNCVADKTEHTDKPLSELHRVRRLRWPSGNTIEKYQSDLV